MKIENLLKQFKHFKAFHELAGFSEQEISIASHFRLSADGSNRGEGADEYAHLLSGIREHLISELKKELDRMQTSEDEEDIQSLCDFLEKNQDITSLAFRPLLRMMSNEHYSIEGYIEDVLATKAMEDKLICPASLRDSEEVESLLKTILVNKAKVSCNSLAYSWNYRIFIDWFPKFWGIYPNIKEAVANEFLLLKGNKKILTSEERDLFKMYNI